MLDELRYWLFWPVALFFWRIEEAARWVGNLFEDFATVDYARRRSAPATEKDGAGE